MLSIRKQELTDLLGSCACTREPPEEALTGLMSICAATLPSCTEDNPGVIRLIPEFTRSPHSDYSAGEDGGSRQSSIKWGTIGNSLHFFFSLDMKGTMERIKSRADEGPPLMGMCFPALPGEGRQRGNTAMMHPSHQMDGVIEHPGS